MNFIRIIALVPASELFSTHEALDIIDGLLGGLEEEASVSKSIGICDE